MVRPNDMVADDALMKMIKILQDREAHKSLKLRQKLGSLLPGPLDEI